MFTRVNAFYAKDSLLLKCRWSRHRPAQVHEWAYDKPGNGGRVPYRALASAAMTGGRSWMRVHWSMQSRLRSTHGTS